MKYLRTNGLDFAYLEKGDGPLVLLLHGFPDVAQTWDYQMSALADAGYRAVAPYLRGYFPTEIPKNGFYDKATLANDIVGFIRQLGGGKPVNLVGQDWGATITYALLAAFPELIRRAVVMAVPHPAMMAKTLLTPKHIHRSFHWWFFQLPELPEKALAADDFAFVDYLWSYWSAPGYQDSKHLREIKTMLSQPGVLNSTLGYYRTIFGSSQGDPDQGKLWQNMNKLITVPTLALCGGADLRAELMIDQDQYFLGEYSYRVISDAGHFLHREKPEEVTEHIIDWLGTA
jgi:pimeloyl-ACP methyl ester carboxylesterase